ncbi:MAG: LysM peptidoglycan-binding domain-containing protein, partial [Ginsengibacter sp.]
LQQYSLEALGEVPVFDASKFASDPEIKLLAVDNENEIPPANIIITINGSKAIQAFKGTSLLAIATQYDIPLSKLLEINDLQNDGLLSNDQLIFLQKKQAKGAEAFYISSKNESLYDLAQKKGVILKNLEAYNPLYQNEIPIPGSKINLQPGTSEIKDAQSLKLKEFKEQKEENNIHVVQPGESLYGISKKYALTVSDLKSWNQLLSDHISVGQQLIISK